MRVWAVKTSSSILGIFDSEEIAIKMNNIYRYVMGSGQFSTGVEEIKILCEIPEYWQNLYDNKKAKDAEWAEIESKAWNDLIEPIKHTLIWNSRERRN